MAKRRKEENDLYYLEKQREEETVINMANQNHKKQMQTKKKKISKKERKRQKRIKRVKFILKLVVIIGIIAGGTTFALVSPIFNIKDIIVTDNNKVPNDTIISLSTLQLEQNIFKFYNKNIENKIKENPYIEKVHYTGNYQAQLK